MLCTRYNARTPIEAAHGLLGRGRSRGRATRCAPLGLNPPEPEPNPLLLPVSQAGMFAQKIDFDFYKFSHKFARAGAEREPPPPGRAPPPGSARSM